MQTSELTGDLPEIIGNEENLYEGNLILYFRILFYNSTNLKNPYHNFRHTLHVLWLCQKACRYYQKKLTPRQMRNLLIAALFHDFDHPGHPHPGGSGCRGGSSSPATGRRPTTNGRSPSPSGLSNWRCNHGVLAAR